MQSNYKRQLKIETEEEKKVKETKGWWYGLSRSNCWIAKATRQVAVWLALNMDWEF